MTEIEQRIEAAGARVDYPSRIFTDEEVEKGTHRSVRGGQWDTLGRQQVDFLSSMGLRPEHRYLDIGAGEFHAGRRMIDFMLPGHYYAIEANPSLVQVGYDVELTDAQRARLPLENLRVTDRFDADFGVAFDMAIAQSVFTHLSLNHLRLCLFRVAKSVKPGGKLYVTFYEEPARQPLDTVVRRNRQPPYFTERDVYWYYRDDMKWAARFGPWNYRYIGAWGHHNEQRIVEFTRKADSAPVEKTAPMAPTLPAGRDRSPRMQALLTRGRRWAARKLDPG